MCLGISLDRVWCRSAKSSNARVRFVIIYRKLLVRGKRVSAIAGLSTKGLVALELTDGSVDGDTYYDFVRGSLIPEMNPFDGSSPMSVAIMDNCSIHHT